MQKNVVELERDLRGVSDRKHSRSLTLCPGWVSSSASAPADGWWDAGGSRVARRGRGIGTSVWSSLLCHKLKQDGGDWIAQAFVSVFLYLYSCENQPEPGRSRAWRFSVWARLVAERVRFYWTVNVGSPFSWYFSSSLLTILILFLCRHVLRHSFDFIGLSFLSAEVWLCSLFSVVPYIACPKPFSPLETVKAHLAFCGTLAFFVKSSE